MCDITVKPAFFIVLATRSNLVQASLLLYRATILFLVYVHTKYANGECVVAERERFKKVFVDFFFLSRLCWIYYWDALLLNLLHIAFVFLWFYFCGLSSFVQLTLWQKRSLSKIVHCFVRQTAPLAIRRNIRVTVPMITLRPNSYGNALIGVRCKLPRRLLSFQIFLVVLFKEISHRVQTFVDEPRDRSKEKKFACATK